MHIASHRVVQYSSVGHGACRMTANQSAVPFTRTDFNLDRKGLKEQTTGTGDMSGARFLQAPEVHQTSVPPVPIPGAPILQERIKIPRLRFSGAHNTASLLLLTHLRETVKNRRNGTKQAKTKQVPRSNYYQKTPFTQTESAALLRCNAKRRAAKIPRKYSKLV